MNYHCECFLRLDDGVLPSPNDAVHHLSAKIYSQLQWNLYCSGIDAKALRVASCILSALHHKFLDLYHKALPSHYEILKAAVITIPYEWPKNC